MRVTALAFPALALLLTACAIPPASERSAYDQSIHQAAVFTPSAVKPLKPLTYPVKAATYTTYTQWADGRVGQAVTLSRDTWVTIEPGLAEACRNFPKAELIPRLNQFLGLQPATENDRKRMFVRLAIDQRQSVGPTGLGIFRPCADPDPTATSCGNSLTGSPAYTQWFASNMVSSYAVGPDMKSTGFPWTRLGYTYNWAPDAADPRGAQEYVIPAGSTVTVTAIVTPEAFCAP